MSHEETVMASLARMEEMLRGYLFRMEQLEKLPERVTKLEHARIWVLGAAAVIGTALTVLIKVLVK